MLNRTSLALIAMALSGFAAPALAADIGSAESPVVVQDGIGQADWRVTLKATGRVGPEFEGAKDYAITGAPGVSIRRPGQPWKFGAPDDGFGFALLDTEYFQVGPVGRFRSERNSSDERKIRTLHDIDWAIEPGLFVEFYPTTNIRVRGELRHGVNGHDGFVGDIAADWIQRTGPFTLSLGPRVALGDSKFMDEYFGVSAREAARGGGLDRYKASGGVKSVGLAAAATYDWTPNWSTTIFGGYNRLTADAADSPIVKKLNSKDQLNIGLGVAYSFDTSW